MAWLALVLIAVVFLLAAIPLHLSARLVGGDSSLLKAALTNLIAGILGALIFIFLDKFAALVYFVVLLLVYKSMFSIGWIRSLIVWALQGVITFILIMVLVVFGLIAA